ncbi:hypothetical protein C8R44DRAFT_894113 [Mycena epipterygia]|nr:hypothetical protein C8R44DRAFT_894113 [Mycena epipterygia]
MSFRPVFLEYYVLCVSGLACTTSWGEALFGWDLLLFLLRADRSTCRGLGRGSGDRLRLEMRASHCLSPELGFIIDVSLLYSFVAPGISLRRRIILPRSLCDDYICNPIPDFIPALATYKISSLYVRYVRLIITFKSKSHRGHLHDSKSPMVPSQASVYIPLT